MKRVLITLILVSSFVVAFGQGFPGTDSLRRYNIKYITNNAATAFTNHRLNTLLAGIIDWIDSARTGEGGVIGIDTIGVLNDSTIRYRKNGVWRNQVIKGGHVVHDNSLAGAGTISSPLKVDSAIFKTKADAQRITDSLVALINLKLHNLNIGSGFRWVKPVSQEIKTVFDSWSILWDSVSNTDGLTPKVDSFAVSTTARLLKVADSVYSLSPWQRSSTLVTLKSRGFAKVEATSTANTGFSDWPYSTTFNKSVFGIYGKEPSLDILIDSSSQFQIGAIAFRSNKLATGGILDKFPKLPSSRFSANAYAVIEANAFQNGGAWTSTVEIYLGDSTGNNINVPFAASGPGNHFFGNRLYHTAEAKEALYFGTAINRSSNFTFGSLNTFFAGNLNNLPAYFLNAPIIAPDTTNNKAWVINPATGAMQAMYWPATGGGGGVTDHGALTGLADDDHTQYALLAGRSSGQTIIGGTGTTDDLLLQTTSGVGATGADMIFKGGNNGATEFMRILNSGNVGIGTTAPGTKLHVGGTVKTGTTGAAGRIDMGRTSDGATVGSILVNSSALNIDWGGGAIHLLPNAIQTMYLHSSGVGIGTVSPDRYFHVEQTDAVTSAITNVVRLSHVTSGTAAAGSGVGIEFEAENASGAQVLAGSITNPYTTATSTTEAADFAFNLITSGSIAEKFRITSTGLVTFGGNTSSFPALKRSTTSLHVRLADDSGDGGFITGSLTVNAEANVSVNVSSAGTLTLGANVAYVFSGTTTTWTLPAVGAATGRTYLIKNRGSGNITLNTSGGGNDIYDSAATNSLTITPGTAIRLVSDGTFFLVM